MKKHTLLILSIALLLSLVGCDAETRKDKWIKAPMDIPQDSVVTQYLVYYVKTGYDVNADGYHYSISREQIDILVWWPDHGWDTGHIRQTKFTEVTVLYWMPLPEPPIK